MKTAIVLFAGAMTASAAFGEMNDAIAEERYRAKYGRNTPAEEVRKKKARSMQDCCRATHGAAASSTIMFDGSAHKARFRAKYGRGTPREELRQKAETKDLALHIKKCSEIGQCPRIQGLTALASDGGLATPALNDAELRLRATYGRSAPIEARQTVE